MKDPKVLTIQDLSCYGQCSLTVALPIISACGIETAVIPTAVLSTHTAFKAGWTFRDLTDDIAPISAHWQKEGLKFDCIYTGYLGSPRQVDLILDAVDKHLDHGGCVVVDPAMADGGKLYAGFAPDFPSHMARLCSSADIILPNITEACLMTGKEFKTEYDQGYIEDLLAGRDALLLQRQAAAYVARHRRRICVLICRRAHARDEHLRQRRPRRRLHGRDDTPDDGRRFALVRRQVRKGASHADRQD